MDQIIATGSIIPKLENNSIYRLYFVAENHYKDAYNMYTKGSLVEAFVLFLQFTKYFEIMDMHDNRLVMVGRYNNIKKKFGKSITYMEYIKPILEKKYARAEIKLSLPDAPNNNIFTEESTLIDEVVDNQQIALDEEEYRNEMEKNLLNRWRSRSWAWPPAKPKLMPKLVEMKQVSKTTEDIKSHDTTLTYKNKDGEPLDALSVLAMHLKIENRCVVDVPGDNNCQFHAVADQLERIGIINWTAAQLRQKAVKWLQDNEKRAMDDGKIGEQTILKDAVGVDDWSKYIAKMRLHNETWGDEATLLALSVLFKVSIVVVSSLPGSYTHKISPPKFWNIDHKGTIYLGHYHEFHYTSTKEI